MYWHVFAAGETTYTWTTSGAASGVAFAAAFASVDPTNPVDTSSANVAGAGSAVSAPSVSTASGGDALVATYLGYTRAETWTTWTAPSGMTQIGGASNSPGRRSASLDWAVQAAAGASPDETAVASASQTYAAAALIALRAAPAPPPVISGVGAQPVASSGATISWATDEPADSQVEYGPDASYGSSTLLDGTLTSSHSQQLTGLAAGTTYHYRVESRDSSGQLCLSGDFAFRRCPRRAPRCR